MPALRVFYRLSDKGEKKEKLPQISNRSCPENFLEHFPAQEVTLIADNVGEETFAWLQSYGLRGIVRTSLGNSGSFWRCYQEALALGDDATAVYFVENDYIPRDGAREALLEGLSIADYATLYDHPDKYHDGENPEIRGGGERTVVRLTARCHWKYTNSTTLTFASTVGILRRDQTVFRNYTVGLIPGQNRLLRRFQAKRIPHDYTIFRLLRKWRGRRLASPIPSYSTHGETAHIAPFFRQHAARQVSAPCARANHKDIP